MDRLELLENWLKPQMAGAPYALAPASADASFRRYFRVSLPDRSLIVMDAPPEHEDCRPFIHVAELLRDAGVRVPHILAQDLQQGHCFYSPQRPRFERRVLQLISEIGTQTCVTRL